LRLEHCLQRFETFDDQAFVRVGIESAEPVVTCVIAGAPESSRKPISHEVS
jgi:hypothetical protein